LQSIQVLEQLKTCIVVKNLSFLSPFIIPY
jgi:hypothetical protein